MNTAWRIIKSLRLPNTEQEAERVLEDIAGLTGKPKIVSWVNAHIFNLAQTNSDLAKDLLEADFLLRDGVGMSALLRLIGLHPGENMNGTDNIPKLIKKFSGRRVAMFGTCEPYLSRAKTEIEKLNIRVVVQADGFREPRAYLDCLFNQPADLIILGMGVPKQEHVASYLAANLQGSAVIVNGGAIIDFFGKRVPRAPKLWRRARIEWLYRVIQEPRRLFKRYSIGGLVFLWHAIGLWTRKIDLRR